MTGHAEHPPNDVALGGYAVREATDPADREACFTVRKEVFVVEQRVPQEIEYDAYDAEGADTIHVLAVGPEGPLGTGRLLYGPAAAGKTGGDPSVGSLGRLAASGPRSSARSSPRPVSAVSPRSTCTHRPTRSRSTSAWATRRTAPSSRTRASPTGPCAARSDRAVPRASRRGRPSCPERAVVAVLHLTALPLPARHRYVPRPGGRRRALGSYPRSGSGATRTCPVRPPGPRTPARPGTTSARGARTAAAGSRSRPAPLTVPGPAGDGSSAAGPGTGGRIRMNRDERMARWSR